MIPLSVSATFAWKKAEGVDALRLGKSFRTPDFKKAVDGMQTEDVNTRWQAAMKDFFTTLGSGAADTSLEVLEEVFHLP